jgi:hypothetical protein
MNHLHVLRNELAKKALKIILEGFVLHSFNGQNAVEYLIHAQVVA